MLEEPSCEVFPLAVLQACPTAFLANFSPNLHVVAPCLEHVSLPSWCTLLYPSRRDVHRNPSSCRAIFHGQILRLLDPVKFRPESFRRHGQRERSCLRELHHLSLVRFPVFERCLLVAFHVKPFKQPSSVSHQPRPHVHGGCHFDRETCFQLEPQASNLTFHSVLCSPNCTDALTAESWCCLNLEMDSICACPQRDLARQEPLRGFRINLLNCFRIRHPFDNRSAHR